MTSRLVRAARFVIIVAEAQWQPADRSYVFSVCNLEGRKTKKRVSSRVAETARDLPVASSITQLINARQSGVDATAYRGSGHRLAQWEGVYSWSAIHHRLSNAISDWEVPRRLSRLPMTCSVVIQRGFFVAQVSNVSNLLCRRLPRRQTPGWIHNACGLGNPRHSRLGSLRYGVLQRIMLRCSSSPHQKQRLGVFKLLGMTPF